MDKVWIVFELRFASFIFILFFIHHHRNYTYQFYFVSVNSIYFQGQSTAFIPFHIDHFVFNINFVTDTQSLTLWSMIKTERKGNALCKATTTKNGRLGYVTTSHWVHFFCHSKNSVQLIVRWPIVVAQFIDKSTRNP